MVRVREDRVIVTETALNAHDCPNCAVVYAITKELEARRRDDGATVYCPNGHTITFSDSIRARNRRLKIKLTEARERSVQLENDLMDAAKEAKRLKRRAKAGVCSECHRTFQNVAKHMKSKHEEAKS